MTACWWCGAEAMVIVTRPQDWAEPARRILIKRGAWRDRA